MSHFLYESEYEALVASSASNLQAVVLPEHLSNSWQILSDNSFGNVYLGETFSFYICCTNDSVSENVSDVCVRVELQVGNHRMFNVGEGKADILDAKQSIDDVMKHEVKELGAHV